jgi:cysteine desulfuration protein SufE
MHKLLTELSSFDSFEERYSFLIELGHNSALKLTDAEKINSNLIPGCTSRSWMMCEKVDGKLHFKTASKSQMIQGMLSLLCEVLSGLTPEEILSFNFSEFEEAGLSNLLTPTRVNGFGNAVLLVKSYAIKNRHG